MNSVLDEAAIRKAAHERYGSGQPIWNPTDRWNAHKRINIETFVITAAASRLRSAADVLDVGAGSHTYTWMPSHTISCDLFAEQLRNKPNAIVGDVEALPFRSNSFDLVLCLASVLNYASAAEAIRELSRVTRTYGAVVLHFESSRSFEHVGRRMWGASTTAVRTRNNGTLDTVWVYSPGYISRLLAQCNLRPIEERRFHILSSLGVRLGLPQNVAAVASSLDRFAAPLSEYADDIILLAERY